MLSIFIMVLCFGIVIFLALRKSKSEKEFEKFLVEPDFSRYNPPTRVVPSVTKRTINNPVKSKRDPKVSTTIVPPPSPTTDYTYVYPVSEPIYPVSEPVFYDDDDSKRQAYHGHGGAFGGGGATGDFSTPDSTSHHSSDHSSHSSYDSSSSSCDSSSYDSGGGSDSGSSGCD